MVLAPENVIPWLGKLVDYFRLFHHLDSDFLSDIAFVVS